MNSRAIFIYSPELMQYHFHEEHPFTQKRLELTLSLIQSLQLLDESQIIAPAMASDEEIALIHDPKYIAAVRRAGKLEEDFYGTPYGLGTEDVPIFSNMHETSALIVGGAIKLADYVMQTPEGHGVHLAGGLHHAFRGKASGFCIYNDCAIAIEYIRKKYHARVLYIDTDAHHGDGVQWAFYHDSEVMTISFHETGKYLFPGTGNITERGDGQGYGYSINIPFDAFTEDESFMNAYRTILTKAMEGFRPDVIVTQNGADAHRLDPLTHLSSTMNIYKEIPKLAHELAHQYCDGRWIALGGGGYDIWRVVPRAWTYLWAEINHLPIDNPIIPETWINQWQSPSPVPLPKQMLDDEYDFKPIPRRAEITEKNQLTVERVLSFLPSRKF